MPNDLYHEALGQFVDNFAATESIIQLCFHHFAKLDPIRANIIKNEMSTGSLLTVTKALLKEENALVYAEVACVLDQYSIISEFRHKVIHRGADPRYVMEGKLVATNASTARSAEAYEQTEFSVEMLTAATLDLWFVGLRLLNAADPEGCPLRRYQLGHDALAPWRYRRVESRRPYQAPQQKAKKERPAQPRPSRP